MMRFVFLLVGLYLLPVSVLAQPQNLPPAPWANKFFLPDIAQNPGQPAPLVIVHDFGTVPQGTLLTHKFKVTNIYDVPIQVLDVKRSCGCLEVDPPLRVLQPNEVADFAITMDTSKFKGPNAQTIQVTFGPQFVSTAVLRILANSRPEITLTPGAATFGAVAQGASEVRTIQFDYHGKVKDWKITSVIPGGPVLAELLESSRGGKYELKVKMKADAPAGPISDLITLTTNDPSFPVIRVPVTGSVQAPVRVTAAQFGRVVLGQEAKVYVIVNANSGAVFKVVPIPDAGDGISVEVLDAAAGTHRLTVRFTPSRLGPFRKELPIKTDLKGGATANLLIEAEVVEK